MPSPPDEVGSGASSAPGPGAEEPLDDEGRENLRHLLREKKLDLEKRRNRIETLKAQVGATPGVVPQPASSGADVPHPSTQVNVQSLLNDVMTSLTNLPAPTSTTVLETPPESGVAGSSAPAERIKSPTTAPTVVAAAAGTAGASGPGRDAGLPVKILQKAPSIIEVKLKTITTFDKAVQVAPPSQSLDLVGGEQRQGGESTTLIEDRQAPQLQHNLTRKRTKTIITPGELREADGIQRSRASRTSSFVGSPREKNEEAAGPRALTAEDRKKIFESPDFADFFNDTTRLMERVLGQSHIYDAMTDYSGLSADNENESTDEKLKKVGVYTEARKCEGRSITDVRVSSKFDELFLAAYGPPEGARLADTDGCVLVWSISMSQRPEYAFNCQSAVCTALFDKFQPNLIIGGTYSGSVVLWDTRAKTKPVQRTPLTSRGHMHPVYSAEVVGTKNANNLVTVDTDGRLCQWTLSMLVQPSETIDFQRGNRDVSATCISFSEGEINSLVGGAEDGSIFKAQIHGSKAGVTSSIETAHNGPITSISFHPGTETHKDFSDLLLTTSADWTCKLWSLRKSSEKPFYVFDNSEDYVNDARWHPIRPSIFVTASSEGYVDLWNLEQSWEAPAMRVNEDSVAVNKMSWSQDGRRLFAGDSKGRVTVWAASNELCTLRPDDCSRLERELEVLNPEAGVGAEASISRSSTLLASQD